MISGRSLQGPQRVIVRAQFRGSTGLSPTTERLGGLNGLTSSITRFRRHVPKLVPERILASLNFLLRHLKQLTRMVERH